MLRDWCKVDSDSWQLYLRMALDQAWWVLDKYTRNHMQNSEWGLTTAARISPAVDRIKEKKKCKGSNVILQSWSERLVLAPRKKELTLRNFISQRNLPVSSCLNSEGKRFVNGNSNSSFGMNMLAVKSSWCHSRADTVRSLKINGFSSRNVQQPSSQVYKLTFSFP